MPDLTLPQTSTPGLAPASPPPALSEEVELEQFIAAHGLRADLEKAIAISREAFPPGSQVVLRLLSFPDDNETGLVVNVRVPLGVLDAVERHQKLLDRWTRELSREARGILVTTFTRA
jgi:hypothetical protein